MIRATVLLVVLFTLFTALAAQAEAPRVVVRDDGTDLAGLPAVSGDGSTLAYLEPFETSSDADRVAVVFVRVSDGTTVDRWLVHQRNDYGVLQASPADGRGTTPWRRARNLTLALRSASYRSLDLVGERFDDTERLAGAGIRVAEHGYDVTVRADRDGRARWTGRLPEMTYFCGMSDEAPQTGIAPIVHAAWVDARSNVALLQYGHVYASCMCPSELALLPVTLAP
jgi:hypothetical protein